VASTRSRKFMERGMLRIACKSGSMRSTAELTEAAFGVE